MSVNHMQCVVGDHMQYVGESHAMCGGNHMQYVGESNAICG